MPEIIKIPENINQEIQKNQFLLERCADLLKTVRFNYTDMTLEEYESSFDYYIQEYVEFYMIKKLLFKELNNFNPKIKNNTLIRFLTSEAYIDYNEEQINFSHDYENVEYQDYISTLFIPNEYIQTDKKENVSIKTITLQVTDSCNLCCTYCYQHNKKTNYMDFPTAKKVIDTLLSNNLISYFDLKYDLGIILEYIGGEPWLNIDLIDKITKYFIGELFKQKHRFAYYYLISICSNGILHFDEKVQNYLKNNYSHISYNISIDGNKKLHDSCRIDKNGNGSYDRAIAGILDYKKMSNQTFPSKMTISPDNIYYINEALQSLINIGYTHINLNCVYEEKWTYEQAKILYQQLIAFVDFLDNNDLFDKISISMFEKNEGQYKEHKNYCGGTGAMLAVDYKGDLYPCLRYMESSLGNNRKPYIIGNINDPNNLNQLKIYELNQVTYESQSSEKCLACPISMGCGWCSAYNYEVTGSVNKRLDNICTTHQARVLATKYYFNKQHKKFNLAIPKEWALNIISENEYNILLKGG